MATTIFTIAVIAFVVYLLLPSKRIVSNGKLIDLPNKFNVLLNSTPSVSSLIIAIKGKNDFIQFSKGEKYVEMDYPVITESHIENEEKYRAICSKLGLILRETTGSDGSLFLDADVTPDVELLADTSKEILCAVFGAKDDTKLKYSFIP